MKRLLAIITILLITFQSYSQGAKKPTGKRQDGMQINYDSIVIKGQYKTDTAKVLIIQYADDYSMFWKKAYLVQRVFVPIGGQPIAAGENVFDDKWAAVKIADLSVYDVKRYDWK
jgi:hypothetical protein